jgi:hypothetical protein
LVEHWNGTRWSIQPTPIPTRRDWTGFLEAVSCTSPAACIAVGWSQDDVLGDIPLAERWDGYSWSIQRTPHPFGIDEFDDVSCTSSTLCIDVGHGQDAFAQRWDGKRWSLQSIDFGDPLGRATELTGVSCTSTRACAAVGWDDIGLCANEYESDFSVPVLGFWSSGRWSLKRHPNLDCSNSSDNGGGTGLNAVSCTSTTACTAVGSEVYRWDGRRWSIQPARIGTRELHGVSCPSTNACTAVGPRIYSWNGGDWSSVPILKPGNARSAWLAGVSCASREACVAVGSYEDDHGSGQLLIEATGR